MRRYRRIRESCESSLFNSLCHAHVKSNSVGSLGPSDPQPSVCLTLMGGLKKFLQSDLQKFAVPQGNTPSPSQAYDSTRTVVLSLDGATTSVMEGQTSASPSMPYRLDVGNPDLSLELDPDEGLLNESPPVGLDDHCEPRHPNQVRDK
jgi:hypothetical protein